MWQGPSLQNRTGPLPQRSSSTADGVFTTLQKHDLSVCVCVKSLIALTVWVFWFWMNAVRLSFQTNADLLTLAVSMAKCKSVALPSAPAPIRVHHESWFCLFLHCSSSSSPWSHESEGIQTEPGSSPKWGAVWVIPFLWFNLVFF